MRYAPDRKSRTRELVVDAAARIAVSVGVHQIGVVAIMNVAGLTHGGFYAHFASRDELVEAAIEKLFDRALRRWHDETSGLSPSSGLTAYIDFYLSPDHAGSVDWGCPVAVLAGDAQQLSERARQLYTNGMDALTNSMAGLIAQLPLPAPEAAARSAFAELAGALTLARSERRPPVAREILADSRAAIKLRLCLEQSTLCEPR